MTAETTTLRVLTIPEVRGCRLRCEAEGHRRGVWVPLEKVDDFCPDAVHRGRVVRLERGVDLHTDAAVGFAGVLAVVLTSPDVQSLLVDLVSGALQRD
ncbi:DUF4244 domain-containing protein, partial [Listeria monocytogenes]|nr:DUF4244 domain-containing protein [Listeria monocytogenes]